MSPMTRRASLPCALALLALAPAASAQELEKAHAVILSGGATAEAGKAALAAARPSPLVKLREGHPRLVESATVKGLKAGFHVVLAGVCRSKDDATAARDVINLASGSGTYVREVQVPRDWLESCPTLQALTPSAGKVLKRAVIDDGAPTVRWVLRKQATGGGCSAFELGVEAGEKLILKKDFADDGCTAGVNIRKRHELTIASVGGGSFARVVERSDWHDNGTRLESLLDFACNELREVLDLGDLFNTVEAIASVEGAPGRSRLRLTWNRRPCANCAPSGDLVYQRTADGCRFEEAK
ncbi:MAG: hypothetical protein JNJ54_33355 [Myxococcaceae bacterium]|nr:hypothetical protein [Myxococcaceae bacterium]